MTQPSKLPTVAWIATGGTLAGAMCSTAGNVGYKAAQHGPEALLQTLPSLTSLANWHCVQPYSMGSQHVQLANMLGLRAAVLAQLDNPMVDAVLVSHGTDTLEDMLYFLHLTLPVARVSKPLVFTAAMLPWDAKDSDGPGNLLAAVQHALDAMSLGPSPSMPWGLVMNGCLKPAPCVRKYKTLGSDAFDGCGDEFCSWSEPQGQYALVFEAQNTAVSHLWQTLEVPVVYCTPGPEAQQQLQHLNQRAALVDHLACVVLAAPGHGNIPQYLVPELQGLLAMGVNVVRASRVPQGGVHAGGEPCPLQAFGQYPDAQHQDIVGQVFLQGCLNLNQVVVRERLRALLARLEYDKSSTHAD